MSPVPKGNELASEQINDNVRAVDRALDILLAFSAADRELTAGELLKRVDLRRSTLYRLLYTLEQKGFLTSGGEPQRFRLGPAVAHLTHAWASSVEISEIARPMLRALSSATGETVALSLPRDNERLCVAEIPSSHALSFKRGVGYRERLALGASGRAILAWRNPGSDELEQLTQGLPIDLAHYQQELERTRKRGYAISREEVMPGAVALAAPFFEANGQVAGSIGVFGPSTRLNDAKVTEFGKVLLEESRKLSEALGYRG